MGQKPSIQYRGDDAEWIPRQYQGTIYGQGTAQPLDAADCNERGVSPMRLTRTRQGFKIEETGPRKLAVPNSGDGGGYGSGSMRHAAQPGRQAKEPNAPQSWAEESE